MTGPYWDSSWRVTAYTWRGYRLHEMEEGAGRKAFLASGRGAKQPIPAHHRNAGDQAQ